MCTGVFRTRAANLKEVVSADWKFNELEQRERAFNNEGRELTNGMLLALALPPPGYKWVRWSSYADRNMMISIGRDLDGMNLVVGRAMHQSDMLPAKVKPDHGVAYVSHGGAEHMKHDFEVLMPAHFNWIRAGHGHVPEYAVEAGRTANGEMLYVGRTYHNGAPCVGKVQRSHGVLYIPFDGKEIPYREYEVLVQC
ncbi:hypothetical protein ALC53_06110 [Atta colombica]|uniref:Uncharacterized protein n=1 Tax=Atta colombica TaxID=520822 RepID=A0A195BFK4_9HYME|nr:hypothetical protein ALC53_06110 [Atta colombica]